MPDYKKKRAKDTWFERLISYEINSTPIKTWGWLVVLYGCIFGIFGFVAFVWFHTVSSPTTSETFVAEVSQIWSEQYEDEMGGFRVHRVRLKREKDEVTCTVPSVNRDIWQRLETGLRYEFSISQTVRGCYVNKAVKIKE